MVAAVVAAAVAAVGGFGGPQAAGDVVPGLDADPSASTRVVMQFPEKAEDMLLSGTLERGELLSRRAGLVDEKIGTGPRRDVRVPAVLALADAGHVRDGLQRDHELERSGRGQGRESRAVAAVNA